MSTAGGESERRLRYVRSEDVLWRRASGSVVLVSASGGDVLEVSGTGVALWEALADPTTIDEAAAVLAPRFGAPVDGVTSDIATAIEDLVRRGLVSATEVS